MRLFFQLRQSRMRQIKRNPDNRLARRASPLIGQVTSRTKFRQTLGVQLAIKLFDKPLHRRPGKRKPQLSNRPAQQFVVRQIVASQIAVRGFSFCVLVHKRSLTISLQPRRHTRGRQYHYR